MTFAGGHPQSMSCLTAVSFQEGVHSDQIKETGVTKLQSFPESE